MQTYYNLDIITQSIRLKLKSMKWAYINTASRVHAWHLPQSTTNLNSLHLSICEFVLTVSTGESSEKEFGHRQPEPAGVAAVSCHAAGRAGEPQPWRPLRLHVLLQRRQRASGGRGGRLSPLCGWQVTQKHMQSRRNHLSRLNETYLVCIHRGHLVSESRIQCVTHPTHLFHRSIFLCLVAMETHQILAPKKANTVT